MYKLSDVKLACESWYGREVSKRTWIYWKQLAKVPEYAREVSEGKASHIFAVAILRKRFPNKKINFVDIFKTSRSEIQKIASELQKPVLKIKPDSCRGIDLIEYLEEITGRVISEKTLYRWGKFYGVPYERHRIYESDQLNHWASVAKKMAA